MSGPLSRQEFLKRICILPLASPVNLWSARFGQEKLPGRGLLSGKVLDKETGRSVPCKVHIADAAGNFYHPEPWIPRRDLNQNIQAKPYFYCHGEFRLVLPPGRYKVEASRGLAQLPAGAEIEIAGDERREVRLELPALTDLRKAGWFSGNTHTHYHLQMEEHPDERLRTVPPAEDLDVSVISYLVRKNLQYRSNKFPIGLAPAFSRHGTFVDVGQETRNNRTDWEIGYGHVLFMRIPRLIPPVSTGLLTPDNGPDFPTLTMLCRRAKAAGGVTVWAHSGSGMECPVAVALGVVDAFNVNDGNIFDYDRYYRLLDCGIRLPLSTGTDWWIYDHNRVYVQLDGPFSYEKWLEGLKAGKTFVTNGPLLTISVGGKGPGETVRLGSGENQVLTVRSTAISRVHFDRLELIVGGEVRAEALSPDRLRAELSAEVPVDRSTWIAVRAWSETFTEFNYHVFAHTSPVYVQCGDTNWLRPESAAYWVQEIERSVKFIGQNYRFASEADEAVARGLFREAQDLYRRKAG